MDWKLPNSRIWLAEMDIDRGLDFPIWTGILTGNGFEVKMLQTKMQNHWLFHLTIFISVSAKKLMG